MKKQTSAEKNEEEFQERAAIMEYEGGLDRFHAEFFARKLIAAKKGNQIMMILPKKERTI